MDQGLFLPKHCTPPNQTTVSAPLSPATPFHPLRSGPKAPSKPSRQKQIPSSEVVASGLRVPLKVPVFMAVAVDPQPNGAGKVTFYLKDLSKKEAKMQRVEVAHNITSGIRKMGEKILVGSRNGGSHFWNGQVARLSVFPKVLGQEQLNSDENPLIDLQVDHREKLPEEARWLGGKKESEKQSPGREAFADFCHALLSSNEFLYLH